MQEPSPSLIVKSTPTTPKSASRPRNSSSGAKRSLKFAENSDEDNGSPRISDKKSPGPPSTSSIETKSPTTKPAVTKRFDDSDEEYDEFFGLIVPKSTITPQKDKSIEKKRRPICPFGGSCYRKNPAHRTEQSHPGDSDYEDQKQIDDNYYDDESNKPICPFGKACYRQNPQHKRDFQH